MTNIDNDASTSVNIINGTRSQLVAFLVLNMWPAHFGIPLLLAIILISKRIQRHPTFINLCLTFIIVGISSSLLVYTASLLYGFPPMTSVASFMLVLQMFLVIRASYYGKEIVERDHVFRFWVMLTSPYMAFFAAVLATSIIGTADPRRVSRNRRFFYCSVESSPLTNSLTVFASTFLFATVILETWAMFFLYKRYRALKGRGAKARSSMDFSMPIRILAFGLYLASALSLSLTSIQAPESPIPDLMIATASTVLLVVFGTQRDVIGVVCFWRKRKPSIQGNLVISKPKEMSVDYKKYPDSQPRFSAV